MKRHGNLFEKITSIDNLRVAYKRASRGKTWHRAVQRFDEDLESNIVRIQELLLSKAFVPAEYTTKTIHEPKRRLIYVLPFAPDRIIQHAVMNVLEPIWDGIFISNSFSCRKGKGAHAGSRKAMEYVRQYDYCLQGDISKFYPSIDHNVLFEIISHKVKCRDTLWLLKSIIYSIEGGKNTPIGNYTSQWFGNLYLNELDQMLKHKYKIKAYLRYCDDFCLFHNDKIVLREMSEGIKSFVNNELKMRLSKLNLFPVTQGVDFLGYRHFQRYILLRKSTAKRVKIRLKKLPGMLTTGAISLPSFKSSIASTAGWMNHANAHNLAMSLNLDALRCLANTFKPPQIEMR